MLPKSILRHNTYTVRQFSAQRILRSTPPTSPASNSPNSAGLRARLQKLNNQLPSFLRGYTNPLIGAPATHITSFFILHELTAVAPLFGLFAIFHYSGWTPVPSSTGQDNALNEAVQRFGKWMTKRGWVGSEDVETAANNASKKDGDSLSTAQQKGAQLVLQFATAYVITKALLPLRIVASVWATPWFARVLLGPIGRGIKGIFQRA